MTNPQTRYQAWKIGLTDKQAAEALGLKRGEYVHWRWRMGLEPNRERAQYQRTASECEVVRRFVGDLVRISDRVGHLPTSKQIGSFMEEWARMGGVK